MNSYEAIVGNEHYGITEVRISNFKSIHNSLEPQKGTASSFDVAVW